MGAQRSMGFGKTSVQHHRFPRTKQGHTLLAFVRSLSSRTIHSQTRGNRVCRFRLAFWLKWPSGSRGCRVVSFTSTTALRLFSHLFLAVVSWILCAFRNRSLSKHLFSPITVPDITPDAQTSTISNTGFHRSNNSDLNMCRPVGLAAGNCLGGTSVPAGSNASLEAILLEMSRDITNSISNMQKHNSDFFAVTSAITKWMKEQQARSIEIEAFGFAGQLFASTFPETLSGHPMAERVTGAAARRRERQLRSMLRHEEQTVATEVSTALNHSRDVGPSPRAATFTDACTQTAPAAEWIAPTSCRVHYTNCFRTRCTNTSDRVRGTCTCAV